MQTRRRNTLPHDLRIATSNHTGLRTNRHTRSDTRRFAGVFSRSEVISVDGDDALHEERNGSNDVSRLEFPTTFDRNTLTAQAQDTFVASVDHSPTLSEAQQIISCYRTVYGSDHALERAMTKTGEKGLPPIPDDRRSMYTLATSPDTQSTMDMMWKPKPKVHMCRADQRALMQAQSQAITMMHNAGLRPANKIQCRRRGCEDILPDVEALKYHLHIHNIADSDSAARSYDDFPPAVPKSPSLVECNVSNSKASWRNHRRSKSCLGTQRKPPMTILFPRKLSVGSLLTSLFPSCGSTPEAPQVPILTTVSKAFNLDPGSGEPTGHLPEVPSARTSTLSRGRRKGKESMGVSAGAMLLASPSSITRGRLELSRTNSPIPVTISPAKDSEESAHQVSEQLTGLQSSVGALSPSLAVSPIRSGIKRILAATRHSNVTDK